MKKARVRKTQLKPVVDELALAVAVDARKIAISSELMAWAAILIAAACYIRVMRMA